MVYKSELNDDRRDVLVQHRIPAVGLKIAKQYFASDDMESFKEQACVILRTLRGMEPPSVP